MKWKSPVALIALTLVGVIIFFGLRERLTPLPQFKVNNQTEAPCYVEASETAFAVEPISFKIDPRSSQTITPWPMTDYFHSELLLSVRCDNGAKLKVQMDVPQGKALSRVTDGVVTVTISEDEGILLETR